MCRKLVELVSSRFFPVVKWSAYTWVCRSRPRLGGLFGLGRLLPIDKVLDHGVQVGVPAGQEQYVVGGDGRAAGVLAERLKVNGDVFYSKTM